MSVLFLLQQPFLRAKEAARFIGVSSRTLEKHRSYGTGPKWSKVGGRVIYAINDLRDWVEPGAKHSTPGPVGTTSLPAVLDTPEAARFLGFSVRTIERHRSYGTGPKFSKVGRSVFYAINDLREWAERGAKRSTSDPTTVLPARPLDELRSRAGSAPPASDVDAPPDAIGSNDFRSVPSPTELIRSV